MMTGYTAQGVTTPGVQVLQREVPTSVEVIQKKRVAAYCRVSTDMEQQASSLETQMDSFRSLIASRPGWELADVYADEGLTGTNASKRVEFQRMIADCEAGKIDYIITKSISRFARNTMDCLLYARKLKEMGIYVYFDENHFDTGSTSSEMLLSILAAVAQEESHSISENMKWGMRKRFQAGKPKWTLTYGFMKDENGEYQIHEEQAKGVRRIRAIRFGLLAAGNRADAGGGERPCHERRQVVAEVVVNGTPQRKVHGRRDDAEVLYG